MVLHVFDMDGTLLKGTTASLQIAQLVGSTPELAELEAGFAAGEIDTRGFSATVHEQWRGLLTALERQLASPQGNTLASEPSRRVPYRQVTEN